MCHSVSLEMAVDQVGCLFLAESRFRECHAKDPHRHVQRQFGNVPLQIVLGQREVQASKWDYPTNDQNDLREVLL